MSHKQLQTESELRQHLDDQLVFLEKKRWQEPFRGAWWGSGPSGFFGLSRLFGSTNERDMTDPRTS